MTTEENLDALCDLLEDSDDSFDEQIYNLVDEEVEKIDKVDPDLGALSDAKCGEIYTGETGRALSDRQSRIVGGHNTFFGQHPWQVLKTV